MCHSDTSSDATSTTCFIPTSSQTTSSDSLDATGASSGRQSGARIAAAAQFSRSLPALRSCFPDPSRPRHNKGWLAVEPGRHFPDSRAVVETIEHVVDTPMRLTVYPQWSRNLRPKGANHSADLVRTGVHLARAKYLEYHLHGKSTHPWPIVWSRTKCIIFLPPSGGKATFVKNIVRHVDFWELPREQGMAALAQVWDHVLHTGYLPDEAERLVASQCDLYVRLTPSVFTVTTPLVDYDDDDANDSADSVVIEHLSDSASGVHLRMPPSGYVAAGTKRVGGSGSYAPWVSSWLVDSGCPLDLLDRMHVQGCQESFCDGSKVTLATANGDTASSEVRPLFLNKLKEHVKPHILDSTPNVLSLGRHVVVGGYSFEWPVHSHNPWLVQASTST